MIEIRLFTIHEQITKIPSCIRYTKTVFTTLELSKNVNIEACKRFGLNTEGNYLINGLYWYSMIANLDELHPKEIEFLQNLCEDNNILNTEVLHIYDHFEHTNEIKFYDGIYIPFNKPIINDYDFYIPVDIFDISDDVGDYLCVNGVIITIYCDLYHVKILKINEISKRFLEKVLQMGYEINYDKRYNDPIFIPTPSYLRQLLKCFN